jgi:hypothetical protein
MFDRPTGRGIDAGAIWYGAGMSKELSYFTEEESRRLLEAEKKSIALRDTRMQLRSAPSHTGRIMDPDIQLALHQNIVETAAHEARVRREVT